MALISTLRCWPRSGRLRYDEKVRYKFRSERSLDRFLRLRLDLLNRQLAGKEPSPAHADSRPKADSENSRNSGGDEREVTENSFSSKDCLRRKKNGKRTPRATTAV